MSKPPSVQISASADKVGYKNPPKEHQFKTGQSGNPAGRPRGRRSATSGVMKVMGRRIPVTIGSETKKMDPEEAIYFTMLREALNGNVRCAVVILDALKKARQDRAAQELVGADDDQLLQDYNERVLRDRDVPQTAPSLAPSDGGEP